MPALSNPLLGLPSVDGVMRQIPLDLGPTVQPGLDDFVEGPNPQLLAWLKAWPQTTDIITPVYLWGASGAGKSHLLKAMVDRAQSMGLGVIWLNALTCQMWDPVDANWPTLAVIDDCDSLDANYQHLAFNLFIESATAGLCHEPTLSGMPMLGILAAGRVPPVDLAVRDDLRTRLGSGVTFHVEALDEAGVRQALAHEAARRGIDLAEGVVAYLLTRHTRDLGYLMGLLDRLDRYALAEHRVVTVPLLKQMLAMETA